MKVDIFPRFKTGEGMVPDQAAQCQRCGHFETGPNVIGSICRNCCGLTDEQIWRRGIQFAQIRKTV